MTEKEQIVAFAREVDALVARFEKEFELSYAAAIGVMQLKIHSLCVSSGEEEDEG